MLLTLLLLSKSSFSLGVELAPPCRDASNDRKLFDIILGCFSTIFACTWVSVHPNVPPPGQSIVKLALRRLMMMLAAVIAPEIVVYFAARQFIFARRFVKEFNKTENIEVGFIPSIRQFIFSTRQFTESTKTNGIFFSTRQFLFSTRRFYESRRLAQESQKNQISKTHGFFFCMGGFVSHSGCPITALEQVRDGSKAAEAFLKDIRAVTEDQIKDKSKGDALSKGLALLQVLWFLVQCIGRQLQHLPITALEIATLAFAVLNIFTWLLWWNKPLGVEVPIVIGLEEVPATLSQPYRYYDRILGGPIGGSYGSYEPENSTSVPLFWSSGDVTNNKRFLTITFEFLVGFVFGGIHCLGWNAEFPSSAEAKLWKVAAVLITTYAASWVLILFAGWKELLPRWATMWLGRFLLLFGGPLYIIARLFLLILPLTSVRNLPAAAFQQVDWTAFIPHI
ncbi:hypothetical protein C8J56DRAFT_1039485 [Mycena floridula]|nr:hypothetical protein C8J56DRAFT_1039485 [Mycena floridula]